MLRYPLCRIVNIESCYLSIIKFDRIIVRVFLARSYVAPDLAPKVRAAERMGVTWTATRIYDDFN